MPSTCETAWRSLLCRIALVLALAGCGGTDGDAPQQPRPELDAVTVSLLAGEVGATRAELRVHGVQGIFRVGQRSPDGRYVVKLDQLTGPYAVGVRYNDDDTGAVAYLGALTTGAGPLNVTPLTTFAAAQLFGRDPTALFGGLGGTGDTSLSAITPQALADAQRQVKAYLQRRHGYALPDGVGDFFTSPFVAQAGDPMFDAITALNAVLDGQGTDVFQVAARIGDEARLCNAERLSLTENGDSRDFCPSSKSTLSEDGDPTITRHAFTDNEGNLLTVRGRGSDVLSATLQPAGGAPGWSCSGAGCGGLSLGTPAGDQSRAIVFTALKLGSARGTITLDGSLHSNPPGAFFPPLACDNRYYIAHADNRVEAACVAPDSSIGAGFGDAASVGATRRRYTFQSDGSVEPLAAALEVVADPDGIVSVLVQDLDPDTQAPRTLWKCRGTACKGVTLGPVRDDADSFAPYVLRNRLITLDDTVLSGLDPEGTPSTAGAVTIRATLDSFEIVFPAEQQPALRPCASSPHRLTVRLGDEARVYEECVPLPPPEGVPPELLLRTSVDGEGRATYLMASLVDAFGGSSPSGGVTIETSGGNIIRITYLPINGGTYRCEASACSGVAIAEPDGAGARAITFSGVTLQEVETAGLPGDRSATIDGAFVAPAPQ